MFVIRGGLLCGRRSEWFGGLSASCGLWTRGNGAVGGRVESSRRLVGIVGKEGVGLGMMSRRSREGGWNTMRGVGWGSGSLLAESSGKFWSGSVSTLFRRYFSKPRKLEKVIVPVKPRRRRGHKKRQISSAITQRLKITATGKILHLKVSKLRARFNHRDGEIVYEAYRFLFVWSSKLHSTA